MPIKLTQTITKLTLAFILGTLLFACKEKLAEFIFDISKTSQQTKYFYVSDGNKRISQTEKSYTIMLGNVVDSTVVTTHFGYDGKGLLRKESRQSDFEDEPELHFYTYNGIDSLISQITVNPDGDTTFIEKYKYFRDGRKTIFLRLLMTHLNENQDITESITKKQFDTTLYRNEFLYANGLCKSKIVYNKNNKPTEEILFEYQDRRLIKETYLTISKSYKLIEKVKYWNYSKSKIKPDFFSCDSKKDTVEKSINEFERESLVFTGALYDYGNTIIKNYYDKGRLIGSIDSDKKMNLKVTHSLRYDKNGFLAEEISYSESLD